jgi:hypothetical protein
MYKGNGVYAQARCMKQAPPACATACGEPIAGISYFSTYLSNKGSTTKNANYIEQQYKAGARRTGYCKKDLNDLKLHANHKLCSGGSKKHIGQRFAVKFTEREGGATWKFKFTVDAGLGVEVRLDKHHKSNSVTDLSTGLRRKDNIWGGGNGNHKDSNIVATFANIPAGTHTVLLYGGESCCDGETNLNWQAARGNSGWKTMSVASLKALAKQGKCKGPNIKCIDTRKRGQWGWRFKGRTKSEATARKWCAGYKHMSLECPTSGGFEVFCVNKYHTSSLLPAADCMGGPKLSRALNNGSNGHCRGGYKWGKVYGGGWHRGTLYAMPSNGTPLVKGKLLQTITTHKNYELSFNIRPTSKVGGWNSVIHFTKGPSNNSRIPAIWFFSGTTRMHVRQGRPGSGNDGCDTSAQLPLNRWSKVTVRLSGSVLTVLVNGKTWCKNTRYANAQAGTTGVRVYASDPWYVAAKASIKDFSYKSLAASCANPICACIGKNYKGARTGHGATCTKHGHSKKWCYVNSACPVKTASKGWSGHYWSAEPCKPGCADDSDSKLCTPSTTKAAKWTGHYYQYNKAHNMHFTMNFNKDKTLGGSGKDPVGSFYWKGTYTGHKVKATKQYTGRRRVHKVLYDAAIVNSHNKMHLTGRWEIPGGHRRRNGTFKMTETTRYIKICKGSGKTPAPAPVKINFSGETACIDTRKRGQWGWRFKGRTFSIGNAWNWCAGYKFMSLECPKNKPLPNGFEVFCGNKYEKSSLIPAGNCMGKPQLTRALNNGSNGHCTGMNKSGKWYGGGWHRGSLYDLTWMGHVLTKGKVLKTVTTHKNYELSFNIRPTRNVRGWSNVIHFTANNRNQGSHGSRIPAIWFFSDTTRMHVRQGRPGSSNDGCDTSAQLPHNRWSKVTVRLSGSVLTVLVNGQTWCTNRNYSSSDPGRKNVRVYASDPWYVAAKASIKDFSYKGLATKSVVAVGLQSRDHSSLCMHPQGGQPNTNVRLIWHPGCRSESRLMLKFVPAGDGSYYIQSAKSGLCVHPRGGQPRTNVDLIWHPGCRDTDGRLRFTKVNAGGGYFYLRSKKNGMCVHPRGGHARTNVQWIFHPGCSGTRLQFKALNFAANAPAATGGFPLVKGKLLKTITTHKNYELSFNIRPTSKVNGWNNVLHFTKGPSNNSRIPAIWFFSRTTRMHVRQGRPGSGNDGCDTSAQLPLNRWSKVTVRLSGSVLTVLVNGQTWCKNTRYANSQAGTTGVRVYASDPWYVAAKASIKDFSYKGLKLPTSARRRATLLRAGSVIALKGGKSGNRQYCADEINRIKCNRNRLLQWEKFRVVNAGGGLYALRGGRGNKYCADEGNTIKCNRNRIGQWEKFRAVNAGGGKIALKGGRNGHRHYCADEGNQIKCNRNHLHQWEKFQAVNVRL